MHYTINQLRIFVKIAETKSITRAAEELHLTQPAVSIQLKNFQDQFDIALTEIVGRQLFITDFGQEIANMSQTILNQVLAINYMAKTHKGHLTGRLKIASVSTGKYVMPYFLTDFLKVNDGVDLELDVTNKLKVLDSLEKNEVDFALVSVLPESIKTEKIELLQNKLYLVSNTEQKFKTSAYDKSVFDTLALIYREKGSGTRQTMEKFIARNNLPVHKKMELTSNEAVKQAVIAGLGCSIMPLIGIKNELYTGELQIVPVKGFPIKTMWNLIWLKGKKHTPVAETYLKFLRKEKSNIVQNKFDWFEQY